MERPFGQSSVDPGQANVAIPFQAVLYSLFINGRNFFTVWKDDMGSCYLDLQTTVSLQAHRDLSRRSLSKVEMWSVQ